MNSIIGTAPSSFGKFLLVFSLFASQSAVLPSFAGPKVLLATDTQTTSPEKSVTTPPVVSTAVNSSDEQVIRAQAVEFAKAYAAGDADKIAAMWCLDCSFTDSDGKRYHGRDAILKLYKRWFHECGPQAMTVKIDSLTFPTPDVCLEEGTTVVGASDKGRYTVVHQKTGGEWKMLNVTETMYERPLAESLKDLDWMTGVWSLKTDKAGIRLYVTPIAHGHFLAMRFCDVEAEREIPQSFQLIGNDPENGRVVSWHFGEDGGYGTGHWHKNGTKWSVETHGLTPDGLSTTAIYIFEPKDSNHFTWSSVDRTIDGQPVADRRAVEATRDEKSAPKAQ